MGVPVTYRQDWIFPLRFFLLFSILVMSLLGTVYAGDIAISMAKDTWRADERIEFSLFSVAADRESAPDTLPDHISCVLESTEQSLTVTARRIYTDGSQGSEPNGGMATARYAFEAPGSISGTVSLRLPDMSVPTVSFAIRAPDESVEASVSYPTMDSLFTLYQPYLGNIGAYEPMYFLVGTDPEKSKFQVSFKYRFFNPESEFAGKHPWLKGFHLGYTQTSFWDLKSDSAPFEDTSYKPELFWRSHNLVSGTSKVRGVFLQSGFQHESNGRGGDLSRSTNFLYLKPVFIFFGEGSYGLQVAPKIWTYVANDDETNPDLDDYRGYFDLEVKVGKADGFVLGSSFRWAKEGASIQLDLTYPLHRFLFDALDIYLHAQYTDALAERLINYQERTHAFRLGFSIVR